MWHAVATCYSAAARLAGYDTPTWIYMQEHSSLVQARELKWSVVSAGTMIADQS